MDINTLAVTVEGIRVQADNTATAVSKIELGMTSQDAKLDILVADMNRRAGADATKRGIRNAALSLITGTGFIGWLWEHFHK